MSAYCIQDSNALLLYKVGPVHVCSSATLVESVVVPPELNVPPGSNNSEPGIFKSIHGMVRVVDLRVRFGVDNSDFLYPGRIIVVNINGGRVGFHVDEIEDVVEFPVNGWKDVPAQIPRDVFSRTLLKESLIRLYADFEVLDKFKATGYLKKHIEQLKKPAEEPRKIEKDRERRMPCKPLEIKLDKNKTDEKNKQLSSASRKVASDAVTDSSRHVPEKPVKPQMYKTSEVEKKVIKEARVVSPLLFSSGEIKAEKSSEAEISKSMKVEECVVSSRLSSANRSSKGGVIKPVGVSVAARFAEKEKKISYMKAENKAISDKARVDASAKRLDRSSVNHRGKGAGKSHLSYQEIAGQMGLIWGVLIVPFLVAMVYFWSSFFDEKAGEEERLRVVQKTVDLYDIEKKARLAQESEEMGVSGVKQVLSDRTDARREVDEQQLEQQAEQEIEQEIEQEVRAGAEEGVINEEELIEPVLGKVTDEIELQEEGEFVVVGAGGMGEGERVDIIVTREEVLEAYPVEYSGYSPGGGEPGDVSLIKNNRDIVIVVNELPEKDLAVEQEESDAEVPGEQDEQTANRAVAGFSPESRMIRKRSGNKGINIESSSGADALVPEKTQVDKPAEEIKIEEKLGVEEKRLSEPVLKHVKEKMSVKVNKDIKIRKYIHIVVKGDTLWDIAKRYVNNPWRYPELASLSNIKNPDLIYPGNKVIVIIRSR